MNERTFRAFWANFVIVAALISAFAIAALSAMPDGDETATVGAIYGGNEDTGAVALMFNVYENADIVQKIADLFAQRGETATFFVGGSWVAKNPDTLLKIAAAGFEIGNHGYLHRDHASLSLKQNLNEIRLTETLVDDVLSKLPDYKNPRLFAPPSGSLGDNMFAACNRLGYKVIMWTRDTVDWRDKDADTVFERAVNNIRAGDLVLMHPTEHTLAALPRILDRISQLSLRADCVSRVISN